MNVSEAVAKRITELCKQNGITVNKLSTISAVTQSTVNGKAKNIGIVTIKKLCDGLQISLIEFFDTPYFAELEQEIF